MTRIRTVRFLDLAFLLLLASPELHAQAAISTSEFRTSAQMVLVPVIVIDHNGKTVTGLHAQDFAIFDDQASQQIVSLTREDVPCSVGIVLDVSGSMKYALASATNIVKAFLGTANSEDEFLLFTVSTQPEAITTFTADTEALQESMQFVSPGGMTALIDTVFLALNRMRGARRSRRALLILSDGMDNSSRYTKRELMRAATEADVQIYTINVDGIAPTSSSTIPFHPGLAAKPIAHAQEGEGTALLEDLSDKTGGLHFRVRDGAEAEEAVVQAGRALRDQYVIAYRPPGSLLAGKWHRIYVRSTVPKVSVYARPGYNAR